MSLAEYVRLQWRYLIEAGILPKGKEDEAEMSLERVRVGIERVQGEQG